MSEEIFCGLCAKIYGPARIDVFEGEEYVSSLAELRYKKRPRGEASPFTRALWRSVGVNSRSRAAALEPDPEQLIRVRAYAFQCPEGHTVDANPGAQFGLAMLGASGSSKSHMLPAIICEMEEMSALRKLGIRLSTGLYPNKKLAGDVSEVYQHCRRLPATRPGQMLGPFGYKLRAGVDADGQPAHRSLLLFDIAGEDLGAISRIADAARYIVLCKALMVLIDPTEFMPTDFSSGPTSARVQRKAASNLRASIRVLADTLTTVWQVHSSREVPVPICFVISKADAVHWPDGFDWASQTELVVDSVDGGAPLRESLSAFSDATKEALAELGGELVIDEIEECFHPDRTRYVPASATSTMPLQPPDSEGREWVDDPEPNGVALAVLHLLDLKEIVTTAPAAVAGDG